MAQLRLKSTAALQRLVHRAKGVSRAKKTRSLGRPLIAAGPVETRSWPDGSIEFILPIRLDNGNEGRTKHHGKSTRERRGLGLQFKAWFPDRQPFEQPVRLVITRLLGRRNRLWDEDSIGRGNGKELIDAMTAAGFFHDDKKRWIDHVDWRQDATQRLEYPRVSVRIFLNGS